MEKHSFLLSRPTFPFTHSRVLSHSPPPNPNFCSFHLPSHLIPMSSSRFCSLLALLVLAASSPAISTNTEGEALNALRARLLDPTNVLQSWDPTLVNPCSWFHITCDDHSRVIRLDLGNSNISGVLGPELGKLQHLQYLELYRNHFHGVIPKELGDLKNLVSMDLYGNRFEGRIPKSFGKLKSLRFLRLNNNQLTGSIPRELALLSNLKVFDISNNDICGTIPTNGPFSNFPPQSFDNNSRLNGPELHGLVSYDFGC